MHPSRLAIYNEAMEYVTEPSTFRFSVGQSSSAATAFNDRSRSEVPGEAGRRSAHRASRPVEEWLDPQWARDPTLTTIEEELVFVAL